MRGVLRAGDGAVACRWTAAELHRIDAPRSGQLHVVILGDRRRCRRDDLYIHRTRYLPDSHATILDAVPVTSVGRTLVDCATHLDHWHALRMLDSVSASAAVWRTIHTTAQELSNGRAGVRAIADVTAPDGARRFRSVLERRAAGALRQHGMPEGEWNVVMHDAQGRIREADLRFRSAKLVVEFDGLHFHQRPNQAQRDRAADRRLALAGWRVLRFTWQDVVFRTSTLVREISAALLTA
jgi:very-short-patch-repair endonuclease